jgi:predicted nucleic acid-binding protein
VILVDTSVWVDHLRAGDKALAGLLDAGMVLAHPFVIGELALGSLRQREVILGALADLPQASVATDTEILHFIDRHALFGRDVGYVDIHLLAAVRLAAGAALWTHDRRLRGVAGELGLAMIPPER